MKSKHLLNLPFGHRVGICIAATVAVAAMFFSAAGSVADEPKTKPDAAPTIDTPFDAATMPPAESLMRDNPLRSATWAAEISIAADSPDSADSSSLRGTLYSVEGSWFGTFRLAGDVDHELYLLATKERAVAWTAKTEDNEKELLQRLIPGIYLIETLTRFPDERQAESQSADDFEIANFGVSKQNGKRLFVIDAKPKEGKSQTARVASLESERILVKFSVDDSMPQQVSAIAANGSGWDLTFESIKTDVGDHSRKPFGEPPKDSLVIELSGTSEAGGGLENPVPYTADSIKRGKLLYIADCEVCHSVDGTGRDSDVTDNAADLTSTEFWLSNGSEAATFLAIRDGAGDEMPGYKDDYRDEKMIWDLVNYITSLQK